jgi:energy-coupling factor transporter ATP-binding protein EcfA2
MQADLAFPQSLAEKYRPARIADFIGLERPKKVLSAFCKCPASGAWLFVGPSGVGKSTMALALAAELQAELHKIPSQKCNAQTIEDTVRHCWYAPLTRGGFHVVLADEADQMSAYCPHARCGTRHEARADRRGDWTGGRVCRGTADARPAVRSRRLRSGDVDRSSAGVAAGCFSRLLCSGTSCNKGGSTDRVTRGMRGRAVLPQCRSHARQAKTARRASSNPSAMAGTTTRPT